MNYIDLSPCVRQYSIAPDDLDLLEKYVNLVCDKTQLWKTSTTVGDVKDYRTSMSCGITHLAKSHNWIAELDNFVFKLFQKATNDYQKDFSLRLTNDEGYDFLKYGIGQEYKRHVDQCDSTFGRVLSGLLYINDNYSGGELEFVKFNLKIKPTRGTIILFPSNFAYEHVAHPVTDGQKLVIVTFFHSHDEIEFKKHLRSKLDPHGACNL